MTRQRLLVDVDTQYDFCDPAGALFVQGAPEAARRCAELVAAAARAGVTILGSVDSHTHEAWEFSTNANRGPAGEKPNFPPHCVKGTRGWLKLPETLPERFAFIPVDAREATIPAHSQALYFEKEVYSLFANPHAEGVLERYAAGGPVDFFVCGVATDYCVRAAAVGLLAWAKARPWAAGSTVSLVRDAVAGVAPESTRAALAELEAAGVRFVETEGALAALAG